MIQPDFGKRDYHRITANRKRPYLLEAWRIGGTDFGSPVVSDRLHRHRLALSPEALPADRDSLDFSLTARRDPCCRPCNDAAVRFSFWDRTAPLLGPRDQVARNEGHHFGQLGGPDFLDAAFPELDRVAEPF